MGAPQPHEGAAPPQWNVLWLPHLCPPSLPDLSPLYYFPPVAAPPAPIPPVPSPTRMSHSSPSPPPFQRRILKPIGAPGLLLGTPSAVRRRRCTVSSKRLSRLLVRHSRHSVASGEWTVGRWGEGFGSHRSVQRVVTQQRQRGPAASGRADDHRPWGGGEAEWVWAGLMGWGGVAKARES